MAIPGWTHTESPFHAGELAIQTRIGVQEQIDRQGRRVIREFLPQQHRQFFAQLAYLIVGTVDAQGNPWASILVGEPGFVSSPDDRTIQIAAKLLFGDPLVRTLAADIDIGFLGIELPTRRRNRVNGIVAAIHNDGFEVQVRQSFGNCPQYIQTRTSAPKENTESENAIGQSPAAKLIASRHIHQLTTFGKEEQAIIREADTFFIATAYQNESAGLASGVDVSHRGGKPGFVRLDDDRTLTIPDFSGNSHFNTFGNLELNPKAGLLFIDFGTSDLLYLTGTAKVIWEGSEIKLYKGAERLLRFQLDQGYRVENSLPLRWSPPALSPLLESTGSWGNP
jgi:predicted pyridoxine 5'-phosphate oxidase superfamily flavin-nucleotide-binding protein